ncbi:High-affinity choline uptake protein BetT [Caenispirillum salinarum AK4]|uniref:High-affinity choline uptake protein BetT n=1 Tax=Caenispirillum salinarum AK4 TaxID=1238182 RepID=K9H6M9_9PROT|nr:BCCT family transporter [Caenispirillum salinarum]EKV26268.1 High-affinity choline uptake protein BetT [Caenispirillum salinarum AK4]
MRKITFARLTSKMQPTVFFGSAAVVVAFCLFGGLYTDTAASIFESLRTAISHLFGWYYLLAATGFLVFAVWLGVSRHARLRMGGNDERPEFGTVAWLTMLFAAGMGIGLVFWGVAEPLTHYLEPPDADPRTAEALRQSLRYTFFHWGLHPWAIYLILALGLAYFHFRKGLPLAPRSVLHPLIGDRIHGPIGHATDILCTVGTLLGVATSLGLGAMQINEGLTRFLGIPSTVAMQLVIIASITAVATLSVVIGLQGGVRRLSMANLWLAGGLWLFVLVVGPTLFIAETFVSGLGIYLQSLPVTSLRLDLKDPSGWQATWTLFYWGWWISWSPFVGVFVARISRGRTVREMVVAMLLVPTTASFAWFAVFGGTALSLEIERGVDLAQRVIETPAISLHATLDHLPLATVSTAVGTLVIIIFFITSSDSGSLVDDMVTSGGHPEPPKPQRVFWACAEGAVAGVLLVLGGLTAMQNAAISLGLPMSVLLVVASVALVRAFRAERRQPGGKATGKRRRNKSAAE